MDSRELIDKGIMIKVMLLGEPQVGKTSIISRFIGKDFKEEYKPSLSCSYNQKYFDYENKKINLCIWDLSSHEKLKRIYSIFIRDNNGFIFVYDIANKESFDKLKYWVKEVNDQAGEFKSIIFGNKSDLYTDQKVSEEEVKEFANEIGANFCLVSAKDNKNIEEGFKSLINQILNSPLFKKENKIKIQKQTRTVKRTYNGCCVSEKRELTNCERCLSCCGYYTCKECLETGRNNCLDCCCGEKKCTKETCERCFGYIFCWPCYCCCGLNKFNVGEDRYCCCCCHCPKEGSVMVYGK